MGMRKILDGGLALGLLAGWTSMAHAQVNRCVGADGRIEYRAQPCQAGSTGQVLTVQGTRKEAVTPLPPHEAPSRTRQDADGASPRWGTREAPARDMASGAEVIVVSGYEASSGDTRVVIDRPGKQVLLVLSSYSPVQWRVEPSKNTRIKGVLLASYSEGSRVSGPADVISMKVALPHAYSVDNANFRRLLAQLNAWFGTERVDAHRGSYRLEPVIEVRQPDAPRPELSWAGVAAETPTKVFDFELESTDFHKVVWRNNGPADAGAAQAMLLNGKAVLSGSGKQVYQIVQDGLQVMDLGSRQTTALPLPPTFPAFSWAMDLAYDTALDVVTVVSLGGEGFLYRYDAKARRWLDHRSLDNVDIHALAYDPRGKRLVAWTVDGELMVMSSQGIPQSRKRILKQLTGFSALFDGNNERAPRLALAPRGSHIALIHLDSGHVTNIWTYDQASGRVQLTYRDVPRNKPSVR